MSILRGLSGGDARDTNRLEAFSDGVFSIAITLLVIEIHVPDRADIDSNDALWHHLWESWPHFLGYLISFAVIGIMWANHHNIFKHINRVDHYLILINLFFLLFIGFVPFTTALVSEYFGHEGEKAATIAYSGWFLLTAIAYNMLWRYPSHKWRLLAEDTDPAQVAAITRRFNFGPPSYAIAFAASFVYPPASMAILAALAILYVLPTKTSD